jgi:hypothetical protein
VKASPSLTAPNLLADVRRIFSKIPDNRNRRSQITLADCLLSGLAVFGLKYPSLLQFDEGQTDGLVAGNLATLYGIAQVPSDTYLRECLDEVMPDTLRPAFKKLFARLQRGKVLERFPYLDGHYLLSVDGTGFFSSKAVHCNNCCIKNHRDGEQTYHHMMQCASLVHPELKEVIPFAPEPIQKQDGANKNDCEQNATKRLLENIRREHPHLKLIVLEDSLHANGPHIELLKSLNMRFILSGKQYAKDFDYIDPERIQQHEIIDKEGVTHRFRWVNAIGLNGANLNLLINLMDYHEISPKGKVKRFTWVTDLELTASTVFKVMRGGRARWRIENETFNTLKNQGYHFEHNFGHGYRYLSTVFAHLMMLAFLIDQIQQLGCQLFQMALTKAKRKLYFWNRIRNYFFSFLLTSWESLYNAIIYRHTGVLPHHDTS